MDVLVQDTTSNFNIPRTSRICPRWTETKYVCHGPGQDVRFQHPTDIQNITLMYENKVWITWLRIGRPSLTSYGHPEFVLDIRRQSINILIQDTTSDFNIPRTSRICPRCTGTKYGCHGLGYNPRLQHPTDFQNVFSMYEDYAWMLLSRIGHPISTYHGHPNMSSMHGNKIWMLWSRDKMPNFNISRTSKICPRCTTTKYGCYSPG